MLLEMRQQRVPQGLSAEHAWVAQEDEPIPAPQHRKRDTGQRVGAQHSQKHTVQIIHGPCPQPQPQHPLETKVRPARPCQRLYAEGSEYYR